MTPPSLLLALDYGGTKHSAALAPAEGGAWLAHERVLLPDGADGDTDRATMLRLARSLLARTTGRLQGIGVSFGGPVDAPRGIVRLSHHVPGWEEAPLRDMLEAEFGVPAAVDNDANTAALGEWKFGAGQGCASLLYLTVSTGIGGGWILNGRIHDGADGMAGEIGHVLVRPGGMPCACGRRGCLEAEACGRAIAAKMRARLASEPAEPVTGKSVAEAAAKGDPLALEVMDEAARILGEALGGAISLMNPDRIVLGGGVTKSGERWWRTVRESARAFAYPGSRVDIRIARLGDDSPLWGALALITGSPRRA